MKTQQLRSVFFVERSNLVSQCAELMARATNPNREIEEASDELMELVSNLIDLGLDLSDIALDACQIARDLENSYRDVQALIVRLGSFLYSMEIFALASNEMARSLLYIVRNLNEIQH